jgi:acyl-coenzyme A thioesterase 7
MLPDDTNPSGNVHGGTILKMIEQAGHIVANRHCNRYRHENEPPITTALVRLEKMDFHQPMLVGEIAQLQAAVTYTSSNSLEAVVDVWAENVITGERRHTNTAYLWYVALKYDPKLRSSPLKEMLTSVPPIQGLSEEDTRAGKERYELQKNSRKAVNNTSENGHASNPPTHVYHHYPEELEEHSVMASQTTLANIVLPSDCTVTGHMLGGALMKMMDNAAGICATRHCRGQTVTAGIDVVNFHETVVNGDMVFVTARMVFTSTKSMEIEVNSACIPYQ